MPKLKTVTEDLAHPMLEIARIATARVLSRFKLTPRSGQDLETLQLMEAVVQNLEVLQTRSLR